MPLAADIQAPTPERVEDIQLSNRTSNRAFKQVNLALLVWSTCLPLAYADLVPEACDKIYEVASSAASNRLKGMSEKQMRSTLPPLASVQDHPELPQAQLVVEMHSMLDELYAGDQLEPQVYGVYKAEVCVRTQARETDLPDFSEVREQLSACGRKSEIERIECAMRVAGSKPEDEA